MPTPDTRFGGRDWSTYYAAVAGKPPRETLIMALDAFDAEIPSSPPPRFALDLGSGEGRDTRALLSRGWNVIAVDPHPAASDLTDLPRGGSTLRYIRSTLEDLAGAAPEPGAQAAIPPTVDLVNASFVLPFVPPQHFTRVWAWIRARLAPGSRFSGQFFGPRDAWASIPGRSHHARDQILAMLGGLKLEHFQEDEKDGTDAEGHAKHWHVFHVVARR